MSGSVTINVGLIISVGASPVAGNDYSAAGSQNVQGQNVTLSYAPNVAQGGSVTFDYQGTLFAATYSGLVTNDGSPVIYSPDFAKLFNGGPYFALETSTVPADNSGTTYQFNLKSQSTLCFAAGTRIATPQGDVAVECLKVGDLVRLAAGGGCPDCLDRHAAYHPAQSRSETGAYSGRGTGP